MIVFVGDLYEMPYLPNLNNNPLVFGIKRPSISQSDYFKVHDEIGFNCISKGTNYLTNESDNTTIYDSNYFTNLNRRIISNGTPHFILDFTPDSSSWIEFKLEKDKLENVFKNDISGNFSITLRTTSNLQNKIKNSAYIRIESLFFQPSSICSLQDNFQKYSSPCLLIDKTTQFCYLPRKQNRVKICCYNINTSSDAVRIENISLSFKYLIPHEIENVWNRPFVPTNLSDFKTENSSGEDFRAVALEIINVNFTNKADQYSLKILVKLNRELVRNSLITINADLSQLVSVNFLQEELDSKCFIFDQLIESCELNLKEKLKTISIILKNEVISCGFVLPKELTIIISPVNLVSLVTIPDKNYSVNWNSFEYSSLNTLSKQQTYSFKTFTDNKVFEEKDMKIEPLESIWYLYYYSDKFIEPVIKKGRYVEIYLQINSPLLKRAKEKNDWFKENFYLENSYFQLSLNQKDFETIPSNIGFYSVLEKVSVLLGTTCETNSGFYFINFQNTFLENQHKDFLSIAPLKVKVDESKAKIIPESLYIDLNFGGFINFYVNLTEHTFTDLQITYNPDDSNSPAPDVILESILIKKGQKKGKSLFKASSLTATGAQKFTGSIKFEKCFEFVDDNAIVIFNINAEPKIFNDFYSIANLFTYIPDVEIKNSLSFLFAPDVVPVNLYCSLISSDKKYEEKKVFVGTNSKPSLFTFNNYNRGKYFNLNCTVENPIIEKLQKRVSHEFKELSTTISNERIEISTQKPTLTSCIHYYFDEVPKFLLVRRLLDYCQNIFKEHSTCYICTDYYNNDYITLISETEKLNSYKSIKINNQITSRKGFHYYKENLTQLEDDKTISICLIQKDTCSYDLEIPFTSKDLFKQFIFSTNTSLKLKNNLQFEAVLIKSIYFEDSEAKSTSDVIAIGKERKMDKDGYVHIPLKNDKTSENLACFFKIINNLNKLKWFEIVFCVDKSRCSSSKVSYTGISFFEISELDKKQFEPNLYYIWSTCSIDIPGSLGSRLYTEPKVIMEFKINP